MGKEPPIAHAVPHWDPVRRVLKYEYNGRPLVSIEIPGESEIQYRVASDGQLQSAPMFQQVYVVVFSAPVTARVTVTMSPEAIVMRPQRARREQAILGQVGRPTIYGVNGMYDILDDLLLSWHGQPWRWVDDQLHTNEDGTSAATFEVELSYKPWVINIRPHYYRQHLGYKYHKPWERRPNTKAVAGWCSWEAYRREVSEENIVEAARFLARHFKDYGLEYVQLDDGYQSRPVTINTRRTLAEAWLTPNERFPSGLDGLCTAIKELGLSPGLWLSASFDGNEEGEEDYVLRDADGTPLKPFFMEVAIDCRPENLEKHILPLYEGARRCGFEYIKTDQIRHLLYDALHEMVRLGLMSNHESARRFRAYMLTARRGLGDDVYYLASWGVLSEVVGIVDACRIATDANPQWPQVRMQIVESARWFHTHRILFLNDPDHICARTKPAWAKTLLSLVSLSGGLFMLSDAIDTYDGERIRAIQKCLPPMTTITGETGSLDVHYPAFAWTKQHGAAFKGKVERTWIEVSDEDAYTLAGDHDTMYDDHPFASLWAFHFQTQVGRWCVALRVATLPLRGSTTPLSALGLDPDKSYLAFDFWTEKYLGLISGSLVVPPLELGSCQVIALREASDHPQFLACTRHVSMGAVSVERQTWEGETLTLELSGVPQTTETYWLHTPPGWELAAVEAEGAKVEVSRSPELVALRMRFDAPNALVRTRWTVCPASE